MKIIKFFYPIVLVCIFFCSNILYAKNNINNKINTDSLFVNSTLIKKAKFTINKLKNNNLQEEFGSEKLKEIAFSYAILNDPINSALYTESYIKKSHDINILNNNVFYSVGKTKNFKVLRDRYLVKIDFYILFFFATSIIGFFISILLNLRKKGDRLANFFICTFILLHSLFIANLCLFLSNYVFNVPQVFAISISFSFFYGPLVYLYFKRITYKKELKKVELLHFLPSLVLIVFLSQYYFLSPEDKLHILLNKNDLFYTELVTIIVIKSISLFYYSVLVYRMYLKGKLENNNNVVIKWKKNLATLNLIYAFVYLVYGLFLILKLPFSFVYSQTFFLSSIVLYVASVAYIQPRVFSKKYILKIDKDKYLKSGLTESLSLELKEQLLVLLNTDKIYKESTISLEILSEKLNTTRHNVSQIINEHFDLNFFKLINKYRIEEAIYIFKNDYNSNLKIIDVAYEVGFNNKVTFNKAFKVQTLQTPSQFIQNLELTKLATSR